MSFLKKKKNRQDCLSQEEPADASEMKPPWCPSGDPRQQLGSRLGSHLLGLGGSAIAPSPSLDPGNLGLRIKGISLGKGTENWE